MKKGTLILLVLFAVLAGGTLWYLSSGKSTTFSTYSGWDRDFAVRDLGTIQKIFIADRDGRTVTLERNGDGWVYNEKYKAHPNSVSLILQMLKTMEIKHIPSKEATRNAVKTLAAFGIKVEVYGKDDEKLKAFYVGGGTNDERGTYMIMENADQPYVVHMPAWEGNLRTRFEKPQMDDWRDKTIYDYDVEDLEYVSIEYPKQMSRSFILEKKGDEYSVIPMNELTPRLQGQVDPGKVEAFLLNFERIIAEAYENNHPKKELIRRQVPFCVITTRTTDGKEKEVRLHPKPELDYAGNPVPASDNQPYERYLADLSTGDFVLVQHLQFGKMFWEYKSFFK